MIQVAKCKAKNKPENIISRISSLLTLKNLLNCFVDTMRMKVPTVARNILQKAMISGDVGVSLIKIEAKDVAINPKARTTKKYCFTTMIFTKLVKFFLF